MAKKAEKNDSLHVLPTATGEWVLKSAGSPAPLKTFATKKAATLYAKKGGGKVVTHKKWIYAIKPSEGGKVSKVASEATKASPQFGSAQGKFVISPDFDETPEDFSDYVE